MRKSVNMSYKNQRLSKFDSLKDSFSRTVRFEIVVNPNGNCHGKPQIILKRRNYLYSDL